MTFFLCHALAQIPGIWCQLCVFCIIHQDYSCTLLGNRLLSVWGMKQAATKESM